MSEAVVASMGTTHPWNIAGVGLDMRVAADFDVRVLTVVAGVSAQDAGGIRALAAVDGDVVRAQVGTLAMDEIGALRIGALPRADVVAAIAAFVRAHEDVPAVVDPVFGATLGGAFADDAAFATFREQLAYAPSVILTPNLDEAARLLGVRSIGRADIAGAAAELQALGPHAVLLKGGHLDGDPVDALATAQGVQLFADERMPGAMRGTGCVLAMALACELARGLPLHDAVQAARTFVRSRFAMHRKYRGLHVAY